MGWGSVLEAKQPHVRRVLFLDQMLAHVTRRMIRTASYHLLFGPLIRFTGRYPCLGWAYADQRDKGLLPLVQIS